MDTYPVSGCKLLRSCFCLVMQLNQNQFYCSDPIGNLLISFYFTFCLAAVLGSFLSWWHFEVTCCCIYLKALESGGCSSVPWLFSCSPSADGQLRGHRVPSSLQSCTLFRAGLIKNIPVPWFPEQNSPRHPAAGLCCAENISLQLLHLTACSSCSFCISLSQSDARGVAHCLPTASALDLGFSRLPMVNSSFVGRGKPGNQLNNCFKHMPGDESHLLGYPKVWW